MSNTPKTDELAKRDFVPDGLWIRHARELERENAELRRDVYQCPPTSENDYEGFKWCDAYEELERENAALRQKLELSSNNQTEEYICVDREHGLWKLRKNKL